MWPCVASNYANSIYSTKIRTVVLGTEGASTACGPVRVKGGKVCATALTCTR